MYKPHLLYPFISRCRNLGSFSILATVNNAAVNMDVHRSLQDPDFNTFNTLIPRSEIAGSHGNLIFREFYFIMFSTALTSFYISTNSAEGCSFSIPSLTFTFLLIIAILEVISILEVIRYLRGNKSL